MVEHTQSSGGHVNRTLVTSADGVLIGLLRRADAERALHEAHTAGERHAQYGVADGTGPGGAVARISAGLWCTQAVHVQTAHERLAASAWRRDTAAR